MSINISDVIVNVGQNSQYNWFVEFLKIMIPLIIGGFITYKASQIVKNNKRKQSELEKFIFLGEWAAIVFDNVKIYKEIFVDKKVKEISEENVDFLKTLSPSYVPEKPFQIEIKDYLFLSGYNSQFLSFLNKIKSFDSLFNNSIQNYNDFFDLTKQGLSIYKDAFIFDVIGYQKRVESLKAVTDEFIVRLYLLLKNLNKCYKNYYNLYYFENIEENFNSLKLEEYPAIQEFLNSEKYEFLRAYQNLIDSNWIGYPRFIFYIQFQWRKLKVKLKNIKEFFKISPKCSKCGKRHE